MNGLMLDIWQPPPRTEHNYIRTFTGKKFWPLNPQPEDVCIEDIAHALSLKCRYTGHVPYLYSVGQHSINVYYHFGRILEALLHDAAEAYLPDVAKPIKQQIPFFTDIERTVQRVIWTRFDLSLELLETIKPSDTAVLEYEYQHFRPQGIRVDVKSPTLPKPHNVVLTQIPPLIVEAHFLQAAQAGGLTCE